MAVEHLVGQDTERVRAANDIVRVVAEHIAIRRRGSKRYWGLCPFHKERTPSFAVCSSRQRFKCFGCGVHGDVFDFVQRIEGVSFQKAKEILAARAGVCLRDTRLSADERRRYAAAKKAAPRLATEVADWERGFELALIRGHCLAAKEATAFLELGTDPGPTLRLARERLVGFRALTPEELVEGYRRNAEPQRTRFRDAGRQDREDAMSVTLEVVGLLIAAAKSGSIS